jgi:energy-coupling factor transport system ATP-binding protein
MSDIINIKNLSFRYDEHFVFFRLLLKIKKGEWVSLIGPNGSGKSTLLKILVGLLYNDSQIIIDNIRMNRESLREIRKKIGFVMENVDDQLVTETVRSEIAFVLENLNYKSKEINSLVDEIAELFKINHLLERDPHSLSGGEKQRVALASSLVFKPDILILDESLAMVDNHQREEIFQILKSLQQSEGLTIINATQNIEETFYGDRIIVLNKGEILLDGLTKEVLKRDKVFNRLGIEVPFIVDLSLKLNLYGLIEDLYLNIDDLVDALWK